MNRQPTSRSYAAALAALTEACGTYRAGVIAAPKDRPRTGPLTPIYAALLTELLDKVPGVAKAYEAAAYDALVSPADRYDWQSKLRDA